MSLFLAESFARRDLRRVALAALTFVSVIGQTMSRAAEVAPPIAAQAPATPPPAPAPTNAPPPVPPPTFHPVNLQPFYAVRFSTGTVAGIWTPVPRGLQNLAGVPFEIGGKVELTGLDEARHGGFHPARVSGIVIEHKAARLHLLHGAAHGGKDGVPLYQLVLRFAGGEQRAFRLAYGVHARNWIRDPDERRSRPDDPESAIVWSNSAAGGDSPRGGMRFFKTALLNPLPDREIISAELLSFFSKATPIVFALTLEDGPAAHPVVDATERKSIEDAVALGDSAYVGELRVRLRHAADGTPVTNAAVNATISDGGPPFYFGEYSTDATGVARVPYPAQHAAELHIQARAPGTTPEMTSLRRTGGDAFPREIELRLPRGTVGGGLVRGTHGPPVPNASVLLVRDQPSAPGEFIAVAWDRVTTDAAGRWSSSALPADPTGFRLQGSHPEYEPAVYAVATSGATSGAFVTRDDLLGGKAEMRLKPFLRITGQIVDSSGRASPNSFLFFLSGGHERRRIRLEDENRFSFFADETGPAALLAAADGFAPQIVPINILPGLAPVHVTMQPGFPLRFLVRDASGLAVTGAVVSLDSWNARELIPWRAETDAAGRVTWSNAPAGGLEWRVLRTGFEPAHLALASPADREVEVTLRRHSGLLANVVDAGSKAPLDGGSATIMHRKSPQEPWRWERGQASRFRQGRLPVNLPEMPGEEVGVLVEAPGYLPAMVGPLAQNAWQTNQVELRRGGGWRGAVVAPDGSPAPKASVALAEPGDWVQLDASASLRVRGFGEQHVTQNAGEYEFNARPITPTLLAAHPAGFARVSAEQAAKDAKITLQPWGHLRGSLGLGEKTAPNVWVTLSSFDADLENGPMAPPSLRPFLRTRPDNQGNFAFDRVPPGEWRLAVAWRNTDAPQNAALSHGVPVTVQSGQTNEVKLGEPGRTVMGHFVVEGDEARDVDWRRDTPMLALTMPGAPTWPEPDLAAGKSDAERHALLAGFEQKRRAFRESEPGRALARTEKIFALLVNTNGEFRAEQVPPGRYTLRAIIPGPSLREPGTTTLGVINRTVEIAATTNGAPQELGEIKLAIAPVPRVGAPPPPLPLQAPDGQPVNLAVFRGKWVLLDFWDSSDRARGYALRQLRNLLEAAPARDRLVVLSVNVDPNPQTWSSWRQSSQESWPQARATSWTALPASLGLGPTAPSLLLDPEGRIMARPATLENARALVRRALAAPERP